MSRSASSASRESLRSYTHAVSRPLLVGAVIRDPEEEHRATTPLELFVDLCFVVAVAQASAALHHELVTGHIGDGIAGFLMGFFGVWWAWMSFTWFATAHDADDLAYRLLTLLQIAGVLIFAAGIPGMVEDQSLTLGVAGYVVMRLSLVTNWARVARRFPDVRPRAMRYVVGISVTQVLWIGVLVTPHAWTIPLFFVLALGEIIVPIWAESAVRGGPYWRIFHPEHIDERYGGFTIIVLGESILSATIGIQEVARAGVSAELVVVAVGGLLLAFSAWWLYFDHPNHLTPTPTQAMRWGMFHVIVFTSLAALGAGLHVAAEAVAGEASERVGALAVTIPVAGYLVGLVVLMLATKNAVRVAAIVPKLIGAAVIIAAGLGGDVPTAMIVSAVVMVSLVTTMILVRPPDGPLAL